MLAHRLRPWLSCKTALAKGLIFAGNTSTRYPDKMLVQCWKSVIDDGTTFNQHWVSASQKEAVTSAGRKYILDLQVLKQIRPFGSAMARRDGTPVIKQ